MSDWPSEEPTAPGDPVGPEDETRVQPTGPGGPPPPPEPPPGGPPGPPPPVGPPPEVAERELWPWLLGLLVLVVAGILLAYFLTRGSSHKTHPVPAVVGQTESAATTKMHDAGFKVATANKFSPQAKGTVVAQKPASGTELSKGSTVTLFVSQGVKQVGVPNVLGLSQSEAVAQLTKAGLNSSVVLVPNAAPSGRVVAQSPTSGTKVSPGATVRLNASKGQKKTTTVTKTVTTTHTTTRPTTTTRTTTATTTTGTTTTVP